MHLLTSHNRRLKRGFTLIELLLVIGIIAILAGIVIIAINPARQLASTRNAKRQADLTAILNAFSQYAIDHGGSYQDQTSLPPVDCTIPLAPAPGRRICVPEATDVTCDFGDPGDGDGCIFVQNLAPKYLATFPADPQDATGDDDDLQNDYAVQLTDFGKRLNVVAPNTEIPPATDVFVIAR